MPLAWMKDGTPLSQKKRALVEMVQDWRQSTFLPALMKFVYPLLGWLHIDEEEQHDPRTMEEGRLEFQKACEFFTNNMLQSGGFVGGRQPCIADYGIASFLELCDIVPNFHLPRAMQTYRDHFLDRSRSFEKLCAPLRQYIDQKK
eukprot:NODE_5605_length_634_cov_15.978304_g5441_i0.p1 GENE.NODE_5605_length_634_cov_15.978304_g5441_i0~~NODE_5605_length_634_cov_15.978304_g5441_i0.p1  ORF type:complete len:145 (+),score=37.50 NODE_5605_length_634_cov_15.978304_g5441_i0:62-496(+)